MRFFVVFAASAFSLSALAADNPISRLGLADGLYCSAKGEHVSVWASASPPYIGIDGLDCHDPIVSRGRLTAKTCFANGGIKLAVSKAFVAQGEMLTMDDVAYRHTAKDEVDKLCAGLVEALAAEDPEPFMTAGHNGSDMELTDTRIVYSAPKASIRDVVRPGTILVEGRWNGERFEGTAYAFKKGCPPAPYQVSGSKVEKPGQLDLVLRGAGPVRQGCVVVGYSAKSPHSRLVFDRIMSN